MYLSDLEAPGHQLRPTESQASHSKVQEFTKSFQVCFLNFSPSPLIVSSSLSLSLASWLLVFRVLYSVAREVALQPQSDTEAAGPNF